MIITLLTDFGLRDAFVGTMKGVIKSITESVDIIDLTHDIPAQDIRTGAYVLGTAYRYFPPGTIHVAIVDPGVGGSRTPIAVHIGDAYFLCPDNGMLTYVLAEEPLHSAIALTDPAYHLKPVSNTFHGRDIFAPAAALLASGTALTSLGPSISKVISLPTPKAELLSNAITAHVVHFDGFGNAYTDLSEEAYREWENGEVRVTVDGIEIPGPMPAYSNVLPGMPVAVFGSNNHLEIALREGDARQTLNLTIGSEVQIVRR
jgi:S-adenosylmethionine hydrolase